MTQGAAPGASAPWQAAAEPSLAGGSEVWLRLWVLVLTRFLFEPSERLWWVWGLIRNVILPLLSSCWNFFALRRGVSFFGGIQHSPVDGSAASSNFGVLTGEDECMSFYSTILPTTCNSPPCGNSGI